MQRSERHTVDGYVGASATNARQLRTRHRDLHQALDIDRRQVGEQHLKYATHLLNFATVEAAAGKRKQAENDLGIAIGIMKADVHRPRHPNVIDALANLGSVLRAQGDTPARNEC